MKRILALMFVLFLFLGAPLIGRSSLPVKSIQPLQLVSEDYRTICTAWSINQEAYLWATAAHCVVAPTEDPTEPLGFNSLAIHNKPVRIILADPDGDLAVVQSDTETAPTLHKGTYPELGEAISVYGYMWGGPNPTLFEGKYANYLLRGYAIFDCRVGPGHSGSPVLDASGRVISVVQIATLGFSGGAPYNMLEELDQYWGM